MWVNLKFLVLLFQCTRIASAQFEGCDNIYSVNYQNDVIVRSPYYPGKYPANTSCRYTFRTTDGYGITLQCYINVANDYFLVSEDADPNLRGASQFSGYGTLVKHSEYNQISFAYISRQSNGGSFNCTLSVQTQTCDCGWSLRGRIVGGTNTFSTEYPGMASLVRNNQVFCGGFIITSRCILTAAHCVSGITNFNELFILVGYNSFAQSSGNRYGQTYGVQNILKHPYYNGDDNDIAIVFTSTEIYYSRGVGPICLPMDTTFNFDYREATLVGSGTTSFGGQKSNNLQKTNVQIIRNSACQYQYSQIRAIRDTQMCTYRNNSDACQNDSGGPLVYSSPDRQFACGVIQGGNGCGNEKYPGIEMRVTSYVDWIQRNVQGILCKKPIR